MTSGNKGSTGESIYNDFVLEGFPLETIAEERGLPILTARKMLLDFASLKTFRKCTSFWIVSRLLIAIDVLVVGIAAGALIYFRPVDPAAYVLCAMVTGAVGAFIWAPAQDMHDTAKSVSRGIRQTFPIISEADLRLRLQAFELNSSPRFWLNLSIKELKDVPSLKGMPNGKDFLAP